jgi:CrcB protein
MIQSGILVALGGALGAVCRWLIAVALQRKLDTALPAATLLVNVLGCCAAGALIGWLESRASAGDGMRLFLIVGLLGGFTTFSAFGIETLDMLRAGRSGAAFAYVALSVLIGVGAAWLGRTWAS